MGQVKFGTRQLKNPTPHKISLWMDFLAGFFSILSGFFTTASFISHNISDIVTSLVSMLVVPTLLLTKRFFGVPQVDDTVPVEDVNEIETDKDK